MCKERFLVGMFESRSLLLAFYFSISSGLVILQCSQKSPEAAARYQVPGGDIEEEEFLRAGEWGNTRLKRGLPVCSDSHRCFL